MTSPVRVLVSVDTEEDDWGSYASSGATVENIVHLVEVADMFERFGVRPTYFINRPPLLSADATAVLRRVTRSSAVEVGTHCHPWNTPPFEGPTGQAGSMMSALPPALNEAKVRTVTDLIEERLGVRPTSFRAGRWGFGPTVSDPLHRLGYEVDSSVTPYINWTEMGGPDYTRSPHRVYRFDPAAPFEATSGGELVEVPASVGFMRGDHEAAARIRSRLERSQIRRLRVIGLLDRMGFLRRRGLSPEVSTPAELMALARSLVAWGSPFLHVTFHSNALLPGATPFVRTKEDRRAFFASLECFLEYCAGCGYQFMTVGAAAADLAPRPGDPGASGSGEA